jgi:WD40 repeat protein
LAAFDAAELRQFCQDRLAFRPVLNLLGQGHGLDDMVDELVGYCQTRLLFDRLLVDIRAARPRQYARFDRELHIPAAALARIRCPYRGLEPFEAEHADDFFGRDAMLEQLLDAIYEHNFVTVTGASGCGKSSLVRAGLVTALEAGALPGSRFWAIRLFRPGPEPLRSLSLALVDLLEPEASEVTRIAEARALADHLREGTLAFADVAARLEQDPNTAPLVLIADQFEELYTECRDPGLQQAFISTLLDAAEQEFTVVITLRADFYGHVLADRRLGQAVGACLVNVLPMSPDELREAIEQPTLRSGRVFEPGLVDRIIEDVAGEPGNLPLLQFALTELWGRQTEDGVLTHDAYEGIGEVAGAISRRAEAVYEELAKQGQGEAIRRIFLRLTHYGEGAEGTRRQATLEDLVTPRTPRDEVAQSIQALADARLLVTGHDPVQAATAEVSHEALIRGWSRLRRWLDEDRAFGLWREKLAAARSTWRDTEGDEGALLRGAPLSEAEGWLAERADDLNQAEKAFVEESLDLRQREEKEREAQRQRELEAAQQLAEAQQKRAEVEAASGRRFRILAAVLALVFLAAVAAAIYAGVKGQEASANLTTSQVRATSLAAEVDSRSTEVARRTTAEADIERQAEALSTEVVKRSTAEADADAKAQLAEAGEATAIAALALAKAETDRADHQARIALSRQLAAQSAAELEANHLEVALLLAIEAGRAAETSEALAALRQALAQPGRELQVLVGHANTVGQATWDRQGGRVLTTGDDGTVRVWDAATAVQLLSVPSLGVFPWQAAWDQDQNQILTLPSLYQAVVVDATTGDELLTLPQSEGIIGLAEWNPGPGGAGSGIGSDPGEDAPAGLPKGAYILTGDPEGTLRLWDSTTGEKVLTLSGHDDFVFRASWHPDGRRLATSGFDDAVLVWDLRSALEAGTGNAAPLLQLPGNGGYMGAGWSPGGDRLLTADEEGVCTVWDAQSGEQMLTLEGHSDELYVLAWNPDGTKILTAGWDGTGRVWDAATGDELTLLRGHGSGIAWAEWQPRRQPSTLEPIDDGFILTASADGTARVWDAESGEELARLVGHTAGLNQAQWSPDGSQVVTASEDGTARIWDVRERTELPILADHKWYVIDATWSSDGSRILTTDGGGTARIWDPETGQVQLTLSAHVEDAEAEWDEGQGLILTWGCDEKETIFNCMASTARLWDDHTGRELATLRGHEGWLWEANRTNAPPGSRGSAQILTASEDGTARAWDARSGEELLRLDAHSAGVRGVRQGPADASGGTPGEYRLLTWGCDSGEDSFTCEKGSAKVWDGHTGQRLLELAGHARVVEEAAWNNDGSLILTSGRDHMTQVWDAVTGALLQQLDGRKAAWNPVPAGGPKSDRILTAYPSTWSIWDARSGKELVRAQGSHDGDLQEVVWSATGDQILSFDKLDARLWDARSGELLTVMTGHAREVWAALWNDDESRVTTTSLDGTAWIWDSATGEELAVLSGHTDGVTSAAWSPDGRRLLTASEDGTVRLWYTHVEDLVDAACQLAPRNLTRDEWARFMKREDYRRTCTNIPVVK